MAGNLRSKIPQEANLLVYDTNREACNALATKYNGITVASSLQEIGEKADCIITMLPNSEHVEECMIGDKGICPASSSTPGGKLLIDCSTMDPFRSQKIGQDLASRNIGQFIDCPVSGGVNGAKAGTLSFMIGLPSCDPRAEKVLKTMGTTLHWCGAPGSGLSAKLVNNYLLAMNNVATCEAMNLGVKLGLDAGVLGRVINSSTGKCWPSEKNNPVAGISPGAPVDRDYEGGFGIDLMKKDLGLAIKAGEGVGAWLGGKEYLTQIYDKTSQDPRFKGKDFGVVYKYVEDQSKK